MAATVRLLPVVRVERLLDDVDTHLSSASDFVNNLHVRQLDGRLIRLIKNFYLQNRPTLINLRKWK